MNTLVLALLACGSPTVQAPEPAPSTRPAVVPDDAIHIALTPDGLTLDGEPVPGFDSAELTSGLHPPLLAVLKPQHPVWITAPERTEWLYVRKLFVTSREAGSTDIWLGLLDASEAFQQPGASRARFGGRCPDGPRPITGVVTSLSLNLHHSPDASWTLGRARFHPLVGHGENAQPHLDLPPSCWDRPSCEILPAALRPSCEAATQQTPLASWVPIGGSQGCLSPLLKQLDGAASWREALRASLAELAPAPDTETLLMIEAQVPWTAVVALLGAFDDQGLSSPTLGLPLLEGHEGPPTCDAPIRSGEDLDRAAAIWLGSQLQQP